MYLSLANKLNQKPPPGSIVDWDNPLSKGLVGCWLMNEGTGVICTDLTRNNNGKISGSFKWANSSNGNSFYSASNGSVAVHRISNLIKTGSLTVVGHTFLNSTSDYACLFSSSDGPASNDVILLTKNGNYIIAAAGSSGYGSGTQPAIPVVANRYYKLALTYNHKTLAQTSYLNTKVFGTGTVTRGSSYATTAYIGKAWDASTAACWHIYHVYVFNRCLHGAEITDLHKYPYAFVKPQPTTKYYFFNDLNIQGKTESVRAPNLSFVSKLNQKPPPGSVVDWDNPLSKGLVGCWLFNEGSGNTVNNLAKPTKINAIGSSLKRNQQGLKFNGSSDYIKFAPNVFANGTLQTPITVIFGGYSNTGDQVAVSCGEVYDANYGWNIGLSGGKPSLYRGTSSVYHQLSNSIANGYHIFGFSVHSSVNRWVACDKTLQWFASSLSINAVYGSVAFGVLYMNASPYAGTYWNGTIDFVHIWSRALTPEVYKDIRAFPYSFIKPPPAPKSYFFNYPVEVQPSGSAVSRLGSNLSIAKLNQKPPPGSTVDWDNPLTKGLVGCWLFNEASGNVARDIAGNYHAVKQAGKTSKLNSRGLQFYTEIKPWLASKSETLTAGPTGITFYCKYLTTNTTVAYESPLSKDLTNIWDGHEFGFYLQAGIMFSVFINNVNLEISKTYTKNNILNLWGGYSKITKKQFGRINKTQNSVTNNNYVTVNTPLIIGSTQTAQPANGTIIYAAVWNRPLSTKEMDDVDSYPYSFIKPPAAPKSYFFGDQPSLGTSTTLRMPYISIANKLNQKPPPGSTVDWNHPLSHQLKGCWLFNEGSGTVGNNLANVKNPGKVISSRISPLGFNGNGTSSTVNITNPINVQKPFTVICRCLTTDVTFVPSGYSQTALHIYQDSNNYIRAGNFETTPAGKLFFALRINAGSSNNFASTNAIFSNNKFTTWAVTYDGISNVLFYSNGIAIPAATQGTTFSIGNTSQIGARSTSNAWWKGFISYVMLYQQCLSEEAIAELYAAPYQFIQQTDYNDNYIFEGITSGEGLPATNNLDYVSQDGIFCSQDTKPVVNSMSLDYVSQDGIFTGIVAEENKDISVTVSEGKLIDLSTITITCAATVTIDMSSGAVINPTINTITGSATTVFSVKLNRNATSTIAGLSTVTPVAIVNRSLTSTITGAATVTSTAKITRILSSINIGGAATVTGSAKIARNLTSTITAAATIAVTGKVYRNVSLTIAGTSSTTFQAGIVQKLSVTIPGVATVSATVASVKSIAVAINAAATCAATAKIGRRLTSNITAAATVTAAAICNRRLVSTIAGVAVVSPSIRVQRNVSTTINGTSTTSYSLKVNRNLTSTINGVCNVTAAAKLTFHLGATIAGRSTVTASFAPELRTVVCSIHGTSSVSATAVARYAIAVAMAGSASVITSAAVQKNLTSVIHGGSTVSVRWSSDVSLMCSILARSRGIISAKVTATPPLGANIHTIFLHTLNPNDKLVRDYSKRKLFY